jgi:tellurite resistance protein
VVGRPTDADWILKAMVAMAAADGRLDAREVGLIQKIYQDLTSHSVDASGVVLAVQVYATSRDVLRELSAETGSMSRETKVKSIRAAHLTLLANGRIAEEERQKLKDIAAALRFSESDLEAIVEEPSSAHPAT